MILIQNQKVTLIALDDWMYIANVITEKLANNQNHLVLPVSLNTCMNVDPSSGPRHHAYEISET